MDKESFTPRQQLQLRCANCGTKYDDMVCGECDSHEPLTIVQSESSYILPPADANGKRPRLFYWEEAEDCWCQAETLKVEDIISVDLFMGDGQTEEVRFKRMDMTDAEFAAIPEG